MLSDKCEDTCNHLLWVYFAQYILVETIAYHSCILLRSWPVEVEARYGYGPFGYPNRFIFESLGFAQPLSKAHLMSHSWLVVVSSTRITGIVDAPEKSSHGG